MWLTRDWDKPAAAAISPLIYLLGFIGLMACSIDLNNEFRLNTIEICDIDSQRMLTAEFLVATLSVSQ